MAIVEALDVGDHGICSPQPAFELLRRHAAITVVAHRDDEGVDGALARNAAELETILVLHLGCIGKRILDDDLRSVLHELAREIDNL